MATSYRYRMIDLSELHAADLQREAAAYGWAMPQQAYSITIYDEHGNQAPEAAEALHMTGTGRVGIAWGADASWADYDDIEEAISDWLHDPDEYEARN